MSTAFDGITIQRVMRRRAGQGLLRKAPIACKRVLNCFEMIDADDVPIAALWNFLLAPSR